ALSILVIDDEPSVRETLAEMLEIMGHRVLLAESGSNALQLLAANACDLVFTDLAMPEMDGWETAREIRKRWPAMDVILVTGYGTGTVPPEGEDRLVNGIIGKPFDFSQISQTITSLLANQPVLANAGV
ncbi:MAG TPA: response regulator, partial [Pyrinomonadaceae bacterium]